ncbi:MAG: TVP38/TMEM64 family protein [Bdellovibrionales bacterium]
MKKIALASVIFITVGLIIYFDLHHYLSFAKIKEIQGDLAAYTAEHYFFVIISFCLIYILSTALSIPGASLLTLLSGALFGVVAGTIAVSIASTLGATLAFLGSRFLLKDWVESKFSSHLDKINTGIEKEGGFYLFSLRLIPIFPFFVVNLLTGLTKLKTRTYMWVSQLGMLPATVIYVNAGTRLSELESPSGILSPALIFSFAALGVLPVASKKLIETLKSYGKN